ncbi:MAG TPA: HEAT repeat domain-containing protein [Sedimentisphaerales bacterium]|nr:HEAT repeat domain-containing protein [Phycisphaerae bacterium]HON91424.1 HEAT repeat domain-containing protein [Sedimentisphaerales bacterium]HQG47674.1 HEAT repeat domain-containing protein [Sedimentisphaerales bacterium]
MKAPRHHILMLLFIAVGLRAAYAQEATLATAGAEEVSPTTQIDTQLRINKTTLLENQTSKNRVDAALLLLTSENPEARKILLEVLALTDNPNARAAVCEAISLTRSGQQPIRAKEDFIKPLIAMIVSEPDYSIVRLAAEATLVFNYSQVQQDLERAVTDPSLPVIARTNVIYAMRRHPDKQAVIKLLSLMDAPEPQIVEAARSALAAVGISASSDPTVRRQMRLELEQRSVETFLRDRVIRQETRMRENESERESLWKKHLTDKTALYNLQGTEDAKVRFLATNLGDRDARIKLWALERLEELRVGTSKAKFSTLEPALIALISDPSRDVRRNTARLLASLWEVNVAKPLLDQLNVETDEGVRREILVALREACYASLTTPGPKLPEEIRAGTLSWAVKFLEDADPEKARVGAEVIGKLLEPNGLRAAEVNGYLKTLADRYSRLSPANDIGLRADLLNAMAGLCSSESKCRELAAKQFGGLFEQAIGEKADSVRLIAVAGLFNASSDKSHAVRRLWKSLGEDPLPAIRLRVIDLAGEAGGPQELDWLSEKLGVSGESDPAWQAILRIFRRSSSTLLAEWVAKIKSAPLVSRLTPEQQISFFDMVRQRAQAEAKPELLREAQTNLADLYMVAGRFKEASESLRILAAGATGQELAKYQGQLLQAYLGLGSIEEVCGLLVNYLPTKGLDLTPEGWVAKSIEAYLSNPATANPQVLLDALQQVKVSDPQVSQEWRTLLGGWTERYAKARKTGENNLPGN